ncbi:NADH-quinone oxidoreductase subunit D [Halobacteriovorax sp. HLS]|uniref:NADH-quinone oxidoreductase subunit D n=1 Tax=Halobacteriovorax sp. HLS TaxID=2234000 RepID=UPI000FDBE271|nr:NADH-quinone oxidoreductase subunit D [Halobacteriovorax sp. HLS]
MTDMNTEKLKTELLTLNMGPQHPATHGVLRVEIKTDSETIAEAIPHLGYLHRCKEKHSEYLDYRGIIPYTDRMDYLASMNMEHGYCLAIEKMLGTEVPRRAEYVRVIVAELQRIASHLMFFGTYAIDLGAFSPFLYAFQDREFILRIFEELSGARLLYNYIWIGGVWTDINDAQLKRIENFLEELEENVKKYHSLVGENSIFIGRTANVGVISEEMAYEYGATGPVLRGSGIDWDLRKKRPYSIYEEFDFDVITGKGLKGQVGDCWDRYHVRILEIFESIKIVRQCLEGIEEGPIMGKVPKVLKVPKGEIYMRTECPRGELGYHIVSDGGKTPYRVKVKSSCFTHVSMLPEMAPGQMIADFVASIGSIDIVLGEVDR